MSAPKNLAGSAREDLAADEHATSVDEDRRLPRPSWIARHGRLPEGGLFDQPCFQALAALGPDRIERLAESLIVSTPGCLGADGAWRIMGHRLCAAQIVAAAIFHPPPGLDRAALPPFDPDARDQGAFEDPAGPQLRQAIHTVMDGFGWILGAGFAPHALVGAHPVEKIMAALCFPLAHPDLAREHALERGYAGLAAALDASLACSEARAIDESLAPGFDASPVPAPRL